MRKLLLVLVLMALWPAAGWSQTGGEPVVEELAKLNATLREIAGLMKKQEELQRVDLLIKRVQMTAGQLTDAERQLKTAESELRSLDHEKGELEGRLAMLSASDGKAEDLSPEQSEVIVARIDEELKRVRQRSSELRGEVEELRNRIAAREHELRDWQAVIDRRLGS
ncbi:MAG TPA: hypothetical protein VGC93_12120 [Thermoanaerobaculia bacterium]